MLFHLKRNILIFSVIAGIGLFLFLWHHNLPIDDLDRHLRLQKISEDVKNEANKIACRQPKLELYSPEIMKFVKPVPPINCAKSGMDWVKCRGSECVIQAAAIRKHGPIKCSFTDILRVNDHELTDGETTLSTEYYKLEKSDVVRVSCYSSDKKWSATLTGIRLDNDIWDNTSWEEMPDRALRMNVLMFGYDSLSRNAFRRKLPKSYEYLTQELRSIVLEGYNIVGDGTPQALIPILTGQTELELPDTRKRLKNTHYLNTYPFVWNDYKKVGYVTAFFEDMPNIGTFTYRLNGFKAAPTDHYMRPYYLANLGEQSKWPRLCTGEIPRHQVMLNMIKDFFSVYRTKPKFLFGFHAELSHDDYNLIGVADDDTMNFLKDLKSSGALNNTILIVMADHGHRFADVRNTVQGKQEERLPFFSFAFPEWFEREYPKAFSNFKENANKLTTPFDIYATLRDVIHLRYTGVADITERGVSLFTKIPQERSCAHAFIEPHWCACLEWENVPLTDPITGRLTKHFLKTVNNITADYRNICEELFIRDLFWITKLAPNKKFLKFNHNADIDGFIADMSAKMRVKENLYQIKLSLTPGNSIFEASLSHNLDSDRIDLKISDISRINMYKAQATCVEPNLPHLRKYCFCKGSKV
ncbi:uncharacterized protein LOC126743604 isoform X2 [Anthonomus grandis grandis]|uniref:uncharacterized protein LOC126743604 isoform X2 n=1 Tax=Anthonomus grandis grandis TaxID=2921223 RepID=UPI002165E006|nr:uncharacterized protein LOC126743604 isoform X2 [Anthonomus grandis grandis]